MQITKITAPFLTLCIACLSFAQNRTESRSTTERNTEAHVSPAIADATKALDSATTATGNSEVFASVTIPAGKSVYINSTLDYSSATSVAVTVQCSLCATSATSLTNSGLVLHASWMVPNAELWSTAEKLAATAFAYWNAGGAMFDVYGSQFRLILQNNGTTAIAIDQITLFRRN